jgi:Mn2+/Fe2+ NRAMP family transporter
VLNGLIAPIFLVFLLILAGRRSVLGDRVNGPVLHVVATICVAVVGALALVVTGQTVVGWFG